LVFKKRKFIELKITYSAGRVYFSLYLLIKWLPNFKTMDVIFLIPRPWIAPVWIPIGISSIIIIAVLLLTSIL